MAMRNTIKINKLFLITIAACTRCALSLEMPYFSDFDFRGSSQKFTAQKPWAYDPNRMLNFYHKLQKSFINNGLDKTKQFMDKVEHLGAHYTKLCAGYGFYNLGSLIKGSGAIANTSATFSLYGSHVFAQFGKLDDMGATMVKKGSYWTSYGLSVLKKNRELSNSITPTYMNNAVYCANETIGTSSVLAGYLAQGIGGASRLFGIMNKSVANISGTYAAPFLKKAGDKLTGLGSSSIDFSNTLLVSS